jgi:hypothetical protein
MLMQPGLLNLIRSLMTSPGGNMGTPQEGFSRTPIIRDPVGSFGPRKMQQYQNTQVRPSPAVNPMGPGVFPTAPRNLEAPAIPTSDIGISETPDPSTRLFTPRLLQPSDIGISETPDPSTRLFTPRLLQQRAYVPAYGSGIYNMYNAFNGRR